MAKKETIKLRIPGSKKEIEVPRWAAYAVGGAALLAVIFMRDDKSRGDGDGLLAAEMAQRLEEQRQWFGTALGDVAARVEELSFQHQEEIFEPVTPAANGNGKKDDTIPQYQFIPGEGQLEVGTVEFLTAEPTSDLDRELTRAEQTWADRLQAIAEGYASGKIIGTAGGTPVVGGLEAAKDTVIQTVSKPPSETTAQKTARLQEQFEAQRRLRLIEEAEDVTPWSVGVSESMMEGPAKYGFAPTSMNVAREEEDKLNLVQRTEAARWQAMAEYYQ